MAEDSPPRRPSSLTTDGVALVLRVLRDRVRDETAAKLRDLCAIDRATMSDEQVETVARWAGQIAREAAKDAVEEAMRLGVSTGATLAARTKGA